jgi:hypothetical protein
MSELQNMFQLDLSLSQHGSYGDTGWSIGKVVIVDLDIQLVSVRYCAATNERPEGVRNDYLTPNARYWRPKASADRRFFDEVFSHGVRNINLLRK